MLGCLKLTPTFEPGMRCSLSVPITLVTNYINGVRNQKLPPTDTQVYNDLARTGED